MSEFPIGQDLLRGSGAHLPRSRLSNAMHWLRDGGPAPRPISVHVDLTFRCTARCVHCAQWTWRERPEMTLDQINHLISVLRRWDVRSVTVGGGNPLLHKHLIHLLRSLHNSGISTGLITEGGVVLYPALLSAVDDSLSWIRFSLDGATAEVHDLIRGRAGLFDMTTDAISELCARTSRTKVAINCVIQRRNLHQLTEMVSLSRALGVDVLMFKIPHGHDPRGRYVPSVDQWIRVREWIRKEIAATPPPKPSTNLVAISRLLDGVLDLEDLAAGRPVRQYYISRLAHCFVPLFFLVIDPVGNVFPCDYLQADTRPNSNEYREMRSGFAVGNIFRDGDAVLDRLCSAFREEIHFLPGHGYEECGSCTRFFELNSTLGRLAREPMIESTTDGNISSMGTLVDAISEQFL